MVDFTRLAASRNTDVSTDPTKIPAKLNLPTIGVINYEVSREQPDGSWKRVVSDDPNRMWHFSRVTHLPLVAPKTKALYTPLQAAILGTCFAVMGALVGVCAALGAVPAAIVVGAITVFMLISVAVSKAELTPQEAFDKASASRAAADFAAAEALDKSHERHRNQQMADFAEAWVAGTASP